MSSIVTRKELETLTMSVGRFVAEQLEPLRKENTNLIEQLGAVQNQLTVLHSRIDELTGKAAPAFRTRLHVVGKR